MRSPEMFRGIVWIAIPTFLLSSLFLTNPPSLQDFDKFFDDFSEFAAWPNQHSCPCTLPILHPFDCITANFTDPVTLDCASEDPVAYQDFEDPDGFLIANMSDGNVCWYLGINKSSALLPTPASVEFIGEPVELSLARTWVPYDQYTVECENGFRDSFAHFDRQEATKNFPPSSEQRLSIDLLVLESVSRNEFLRHMPKTRALMEELGFLDFAGYNKVGDNSLVNVHPLLTGARFRNLTENPLIPPDLLQTETQGLEWDVESTSDWLWAGDMRGSASLFSSDPAGGCDLYFYPVHVVQGLRRPPATHYLRPWALQYLEQHPEASYITHNCETKQFALRQMDILERFMKKHERIWHFSYVHVSSFLHNKGGALSLLDDDTWLMLHRLNSSGALNRTVLVIAGDHGQRIDPITQSSLGRMEERMPLLTVRFPPWFLRRHGALARTLRRNRRRLTTTFDLHKTLRDIAKGHFDGEEHRPDLPGRSLFQIISRNRSCAEANIPRRYCACLEETTEQLSNERRREAMAVLSAHLLSLSLRLNCSDLNSSRNSSRLLRARSLVPNNEVRHGIVTLDDEARGKLRREAPVDTLFAELDVQLQFRKRRVELRQRFAFRMGPQASSCRNKVSRNGPLRLLNAFPNERRAKTLRHICRC